ncbi:LURP-one-related family protein [Candidatus Villigracilis saccharophilus]|uniref:LURP-one-related/scramblase family protein n=1 Tax=Candidatus Villigracilis saccharophilus TaxID=3140684 RepID=UPI003134C15B|nr:LURP-one-related family protein [Anaerolineales bacterium]
MSKNEMSRYKIRQNLISIGDDFWIENEAGQKVFKVDGKVLRIRKTLVFEDINGNTLCQIKERLLTIKDTMVVEDANGKDLAVIKKALIAPLRDKWDVKVKNGPDLVVQGNILDHEYSIKQGWSKVAEISKKWFRLTDTYGVEIDPGQNDILILAVAVAIDMMAHDDDDKKDKKDKKDKDKKGK